MKKLVKIAALACAAVMVFALAACSSSVKGNYELESIKIKTGDVTITVDLNDEDSEFFGMVGEYKSTTVKITDDKFIIERHVDTTDMTDEEIEKLGPMSEEYKYRMDGKKVILLDNDGNEIPDIYEGFSVTADGKKVVLEIKDWEENADSEEDEEQPKGEPTSITTITFKKK